MVDFGFLPLWFLRDFPFDGQWASVSEFVECAEVVFHTNVAVAKRHFLPPFFAWIVGPFAVFAVDTSDVLPDRSFRGQRLVGLQRCQ